MWKESLNVIRTYVYAVQRENSEKNVVGWTWQERSSYRPRPWLRSLPGLGLEKDKHNNRRITNKK